MINKLMNLFLNDTQISLNTAITPQNIFLVMTKSKYFNHQATHLLLKYYISKLRGMGGGQGLCWQCWRNWTTQRGGQGGENFNFIIYYLCNIRMHPLDRYNWTEKKASDFDPPQYLIWILNRFFQYNYKLCLPIYSLFKYIRIVNPCL